MTKKRLLFGTKNQEKINIFRTLFEPLPVDLVSLEDLGIAVEVEEDGRTPQENAEKKARTYFAASNLPTLAIDAALTIAGFPPDKQPGTFVRRIYGQERDVPDEELLAHYRRELERVGGESVGTWEIAIALMISHDRIYAQSYSLQTTFSATASDVLLPGAPLSSLMIDPVSGKYYAEMSHRERPDGRWYVEFVKRYLGEL